MSAQLRAELLKLRSTRTTVGLLAAMLSLVTTAVALHGYGLSPGDLDSGSKQLTALVGWGAVLGTLFAGLLGVMSFTGEIRHGTIRPTLLVNPQRGRVIGAKAGAVVLVGAGFGLTATAVASIVGRAALGARDIEILLGGGDQALLLAGGTAAAALWAVIGLGVGAVICSQVPALVGLAVWALFIEGQLVANVPAVGRLAPGAVGQATSGLDPGTLLAPALGALLLIHYAAGAAAAGWRATARRDFA